MEISETKQTTLGVYRDTADESITNMIPGSSYPCTDKTSRSHLDLLQCAQTKRQRSEIIGSVGQPSETDRESRCD